MASHVINCRKCNRVFQQRSTELCPNCQKREDQLQVLISDALFESASTGGLSTQELSTNLGLPVDDIERIYLEGRLGSANSFLKFACQTCHTLTTESQRKGRFCLICSEITAQQAGVTVKSIHAIREEESRNQRSETAQQTSTVKVAPNPIERPSTLVERSVSQAAPRQFGFTVRNNSVNQS